MSYTQNELYLIANFGVGESDMQKGAKNMGSDRISSTERMCNALTTFLLCFITVMGYAQNQIPLDISTHDSTYTNPDTTIGYWFVAPTCFTITGLYVPMDSDSDRQCVEVVRLNTTPPVAPSTTTNLDTLGYWTDFDSTSTITAAISVSPGDIIGVLGGRGSEFLTHSLHSGEHNTTIAGGGITLRRLVAPNDLLTSRANELYTEDADTGYYSRVQLYYDTAIVASFTWLASEGDVDFINTSSGGHTYYWDFGNGDTSTLENPDYDFMDTTQVFTVTFIVSDDCTSDTVVMQVSPVGLTRARPSLQPINIYPNPTKGQLNVLYSGKPVPKGHLLDLSGRVIISFQPQTDPFQLDMGELESGIYVLHIGDAREKIMVTK